MSGSGIRSLILCGEGSARPFEVPEPECPRADLHTPQPPGYLAWHAWASRAIARGARQSRCPGCGHYQVWTRLPADLDGTGART